MHFLIVGNPIASSGHVSQKLFDLERLLLNRGHHVQTCLTRFAGHAGLVSTAIGSEIDRLIVVGGDGTFNEIIGGMLKGRCVPLLQLPSGNANLLAKDLSLPRTVEGAARLAESGNIVMADIGFMNGNPFAMVAGIGFDARVTAALKKRRKGRVNNLSYAIPVLNAFMAKSQKFKVQLDQEGTSSGAMVLICNIRTYAGFCTLAYDADICSGMLDVLVLPDASALYLARCFVSAVKSRITRVPGVVYRKAQNLVITSEESIPIQLDGDFAGWHSKVVIRMEPARIPIIC